MLEDGTTHSNDGRAHAAESRRRRSLTGLDLSNAVIAEVGVGECVGEHSAINRGRCEASVRAKGSTELLLLPRHTMLRLIKRNKKVKSRLHAMMHKRFCENLYLKTGKVTIQSAANVLLKLKLIVARWRDRRRARLAGGGQEATEENSGDGSIDASKAPKLPKHSWGQDTLDA